MLCSKVVIMAAGVGASAGIYQLPASIPRIDLKGSVGCLKFSSQVAGNRCFSVRLSRNSSRRSSRLLLPCVLAAKLPGGVDVPKEEPTLPASLWGFTENAEVWNARAAMVGLFGLVIVEFILHKGILQIFGIEVGKGLDLPL